MKRNRLSGVVKTSRVATAILLTVALLFGASSLAMLRTPFFWQNPAQKSERYSSAAGQAYFFQEDFTNIRALGDDILPVSSLRTITEKDLEQLSPAELALARNEIYARHGKRFNTPEYQEYFDARSWYAPDAAFQEERLSAVERHNASLIARIEKQEAARIRHLPGNMAADERGSVFSADLDGDGRTEKIHMTLGEDGLHIAINGQGMTLHDYHWEQSVEMLYLMKLYDDRPVLTMVVRTEASNDYMDYALIQYDGKKLFIIGELGVWDSRFSDFRLDGKGGFRVQTVDFGPGNCYVMDVYQMKNGKVAPVIDPGGKVINSFSRTERALPLTTKIGGGTTFTIPKGQTVLLRRCRGNSYEVISEEGQVGWMILQKMEKNSFDLYKATYRGKKVDGYWLKEMLFVG